MSTYQERTAEGKHASSAMIDHHSNMNTALEWRRDLVYKAQAFTLEVSRLRQRGFSAERVAITQALLDDIVKEFRILGEYEKTLEAAEVISRTISCRGSGLYKALGKG